jgi:hypothetical protein
VIVLSLWVALFGSHGVSLRLARARAHTYQTVRPPLSLPLSPSLYTNLYQSLSINLSLTVFLTMFALQVLSSPSRPQRCLL